MDQELVKATRAELEDIAEGLYKGEVNKGIARMNVIIPNIATISTWLSEDDQLRLMNDALTPALQAMEDKDGTMLADVISYELIDILNGL